MSNTIVEIIRYVSMTAIVVFAVVALFFRSGRRKMLSFFMVLFFMAVLGVSFFSGGLVFLISIRESMRD